MTLSGHLLFQKRLNEEKGVKPNNNRDNENRQPMRSEKKKKAELHDGVKKGTNGLHNKVEY